MKTVRLVVAYNGKTISIPFKNIALIDEFTTYYDNLDDIGIALNEILDLKLKDTTIKKIYIIKSNFRNELSPIYNEYLPIRYSFDNFDCESVMNNYIDYLSKHKPLLYEKNTPLNIIMDNYMKKYNTVYLKESDIEKIAILYLKNNSGTYNYDRIRGAYFTLLNQGYKIKQNTPPKNINPIDRSDLTRYNPQDEFFEYLIRYSKIGEEEKAHAMDILSAESVEKIDKKMHNPDYSLFDTRNPKYERNFGDDALLLQTLTNMTIQELIDVINNYQNMTKENSKSRGKSK